MEPFISTLRLIQPMQVVDLKRRSIHLNMNLDLNITDYVTVNFSGVAEIIDTLGGIKVNLTDDELQQLNYHMSSTCSSIGVKTQIC